MVSGPGRLMDDVLPRWDFRERHARLVAATPAAAWAAMWKMTVADLPRTRRLMRLRAGGADVLGPPDRPALDALPGREVARREPTEVLFGLVLPTGRRALTRTLQSTQPSSINELQAALPSGWVRVGLDFRLEPKGLATLVTTETRVVATDAGARWRFRLYWVLIRAGSGSIRRELLRALARRAERSA
jgi:hypothetical protein